jgi:hypothetical protein
LNDSIVSIPANNFELDYVYEFEGIIGTVYNDVLVGNEFNNIIDPVSSNNTIDGREGIADIIIYYQSP